MPRLPLCKFVALCISNRRSCIGTEHSTMRPSWPGPKDGRPSGWLPFFISTATLLTSLLTLWYVVSPVDPSQRMVAMSTQAEVHIASPHTASSIMAAGTQPQQQQAPAWNATAPAAGQEDLLSGFSVQFLQQLLMSTNYSKLGSAPLLDPLIPTKDYQQMHEVVRQQQALFCRAKLHTLPVQGVQKVEVQGITLNVYSSHDIVSSVLAGAQGWEPAIVSQVQWAINEYKPNTGSGSGAAPLMVDIGSNVGWITFSAAKMGARVAAFEGMPMNQVLLRHSLCDNPELMQRITLFGTGLGEANKDCTVVSPTTNAGNGNVVCGADVQAGMEELYKKEPAYRHEVRGIMSLRPLDDIFSDDIHLLKIDVEGFEDSVLAGAKRLLASKKVKFLIAEAHMALRGGREGCLTFIKKLYELGFNISYKALAGPYLTKEQVYDPTAPAPPFEVFGVRRD